MRAPHYPSTIMSGTLIISWSQFVRSELSSTHHVVPTNMDGHLLLVLLWGSRDALSRHLGTCWNSRLGAVKNRVTPKWVALRSEKVHGHFNLRSISSWFHFDPYIARSACKSRAAWLFGHRGERQEGNEACAQEEGGPEVGWEWVFVQWDDSGFVQPLLIL